MSKSIKVSTDIQVNAEIVQIVKLLSCGLTVAEIARTMKLNTRTLEAKISITKTKCAVSTLPHLVGLFFRKGLIK